MISSSASDDFALEAGKLIKDAEKLDYAGTAGRWKWSDEAHRPGIIALTPYYSITQRPEPPTFSLPKLGGNVAYGKSDNGI